MASRFAFARRKQNPRKVASGTSYTAKGAAIPPKATLDSETGSSQPVVLREIVPELISPFQRRQVYAKMMNDASVDVSMRAAKTPILGAEFFVDPFSDDPLDIEIAEFVNSNLMEGMSAPFLNSLEDILHFYEDGYSVLEKVYEMREWAPRRTRSAANTKKFTMLKKLSVRPPGTINDIVYDDNGGPVSIKHNAIRADKSVEEVEIPIAQLLIFTFGRMGGDLMGRSLLRTAYPHWYYKTHLYKIDSIQKERHSLGIPKGSLLPGYNTADVSILRTMLRNLRTNEESFLVLPPNIEVDLLQLTGQPVDVLGSAVHHNAMILMNVLGQFVAMGVEAGGGGRATAGTQSDLFMKSLRYVANHIADLINMYLIPELVVWNYPTSNFPKLQVRNIGETRDLQMIGSAIANLFSQDAVTQDEETEAWIRRVFDMPRRDRSVPQAAGAKQAADIASKAVGNGNGSGSTTTDQLKGAKGNIKVRPGDAGNTGKPVSAAQ